ncbi:MAG TPA: tandem-95 repeat protein [Gemmataceae bacterium]|nr:tandem-95 repeat protein [Gemmataceae bacterium]
MSFGQSSRRIRLTRLEERTLFDATPLGAVATVAPVEPPADDAADPTTSGHGAGCGCESCTRFVGPDGTEGWAIPPVYGSSGVTTKAPPYPTTQTFQLHSRPSATRKIHLDFDGHSTTSPGWNGGNTINSLPFDLNGNGSTWSDTEHERIQRIWQRVVEDFSPFDVDVTTEDPGTSGLTYSGSGDTTWGVRVVISPTDEWYPGAGGVAYVGTFRWQSSIERPCFVFPDRLGPNDEKFVAEAISHEVGHTLGLSHDGRTSPAEGYYQGHATSGMPSWAPIMGVGYSRTVVQWSKGEYANANQTQDDLAIITGGNNGTPYRPDDAGNTVGTATAATVNGTTLSAAGVIERSSDVDVWSFTSGSGSVSFTFTPWVNSPNLDVQARLLNSVGTELAASNPTNALNASITFNLPAQGTYYLAIDGVGVGTATTGYTDYGSLGHYTIAGTIVAPGRLSGVETTALNYTENQVPLALTSTLAVSAGADLNQATISITNYVSGQDVLQFTNQAGITAAFNAGTGVLTLSGTATPAAYQTALRSITYSNPSDNPSTSTRTFVFQVRDTAGNLSPTVSRNMSVTAVNDPPAADDDGYATNEDVVLTIGPAAGVLNGDTDVDTATLTALLVLSVQNGILAFNANGSFNYTPDANFNGTDSFTYLATDGAAQSNLATVTITVSAVNDAPTADDDQYVVDEDSSLSVPVLSGVLNGDSDVEGSALTAQLVTNVQHGTLTFHPDGSFDYVPNPEYSGFDSFTYKANDGGLDSTVATVTLTVAPANDAPVANDDSFMIDEDGTLNISAPGVTGNDTDLDGDPLTAVMVSDVAYGTLTLNANGSFTYVPGPNYNGADAFTYQLHDGTLDSNTVTVFINVTPVNDSPVVTGESYSTEEDTPLGVAAPGLLANDFDVEGSPLTLVPGAGPAHGTLTLNADGSFDYSPFADYFGPDSFSYSVTDGTTSSSPVTVALTVTPVNDAPTADDDAASVLLKKSVTIRVLQNDVDPENGHLTILSFTQPNKGVLTRSGGNFIYTATGPLAGTDSFTYTIADPLGLTATATVTLSLTDPVVPALSAVRVRYGTTSPATANLKAMSRSVLPWENVNRFELAFTEDVLPSPGALTLTGPGGSIPLMLGPVPAGGTRTAVWNLAGLVPGTYTLRLAGAAVVDINGNALTGDYVRTFGILPGDFDGNGLVDNRDLTGIKRKYQKNPAKANRFADINGDGIVSVLDYNTAKGVLGSRLGS